MIVRPAQTQIRGKPLLGSQQLFIQCILSCRPHMEPIFISNLSTRRTVVMTDQLQAWTSRCFYWTR